MRRKYYNRFEIFFNGERRKLHQKRGKTPLFAWEIKKTQRLWGGVEMYNLTPLGNI